MGGKMTGQQTQAGEDLTLAEARKVHEIQLATQEQIGGAIKRVRELVTDCQRLQTEIERLIELRRWSAPPGISWLVAIVAALLGGIAGGIAAGIWARIF